MIIFKYFNAKIIAFEIKQFLAVSMPEKYYILFNNNLYSVLTTII